MENISKPEKNQEGKIKELDNIIKSIEALKEPNSRGMVIFFRIENDASTNTNDTEKRILEFFKDGISIEQILPVLEIIKHKTLKEVGIVE